MKTDKFEDSIRKKLDQINPEYQEADWENFKAFSNAFKTPFLKTLLGKSVTYAAAAVSSAVLLFFSINQYNENKALTIKNNLLAKANQQLILKQKEIDKDIIKINEGKKLLKANLTEDRNAPTVDVVESRNIENTKLNNIAIRHSKQIISETKGNLNENEAKVKSDVIRINPEIAATFSADKKLRSGRYSEKDNSSELKIAEAKYAINKNKTAEVNQAWVNVEQVIGNIGENAVKSTGSDNLIATENASNTTIEYKYLRNRGIMIDSTKKMQKNLAAKDFAYYLPKEELDETTRKGFSLRDAYFRFGTAAVLARDYKSKGLIAEVFLDQRISISTGVKFTKTEGEKFQSETDFKVKRRRDFQELYKTTNIPEAHVIANMQERSMLLQLPISINYHQPLKNNLWLVGGLGTDLDLKVSSQSDYIFKLSKPFGPISQYGVPNERQKAVANPVTAQIFNNISLNLGAEKRFGKFTTQLTAFNTTQLKKVDYRKNNTTFGGGLRLFYRM